eukprot:3138646-Rhodomonas_salina.1
MHSICKQVLTCPDMVVRFQDNLPQKSHARQKMKSLRELNREKEVELEARVREKLNKIWKGNPNVSNSLGKVPRVAGLTMKRGQEEFEGPSGSSEEGEKSRFAIRSPSVPPSPWYSIITWVLRCQPQIWKEFWPFHTLRILSHTKRSFNPAHHHNRSHLRFPSRRWPCLSPLRRFREPIRIVRPERFQTDGELRGKSLELDRDESDEEENDALSKSTPAAFLSAGLSRAGSKHPSASLSSAKV